jgi:hypothetical protein
LNHYFGDEELAGKVSSFSNDFVVKLCFTVKQLEYVPYVLYFIAQHPHTKQNSKQNHIDVQLCERHTTLAVPSFAGKESCRRSR